MTTAGVLIVGAVVLVAVIAWYASRNERTERNDGVPTSISLNDGNLIDAIECGHKTKVKDSVFAFGETTETQVPVSEDGTTPYCHKCLEKMAIRCAWCGKPIFIGDPVTLYSPRDENSKMPDYAVLHDKETNSYVGCLRRKCAETGADRAGFWHPPGKVHLVQTAFEMLMQNSEGDKKGDVVIISDLSKP